LASRKDPRKVVSDPQARYYGIKLTERELVPEKSASLGTIRFDDWLAQSA
jgi:hypothetical protein